MISIIIASVYQDRLANIKVNVQNTIGVPYEILAYENSNGQRGICEIYNQGAAEARFEILCFMHEDIVIKTNHWGKILVNIFEGNESLGVIGIAGSQHKSKAPSGWGIKNYEEKVYFINLIQSYKDQRRQPVNIVSNPAHTHLAKVVCVDGVFMCVKKIVFLHARFDHETFKGFHCYDVDFCLQAFQKFNVAVSFDILIEHFSEGIFDRAWIDETLKLHQKWKTLTPFTVQKMSRKQIMHGEKKALRYMMKLQVINNYTFLEIWKMLKNSGVDKMSLVLFLKLHTDLLKYYFSPERIKFL